MERQRRIRLTAMLLLTALLLTACGRERPPDDGTPEPPVLNGTYRAEGGSLTFNGDGQSIVIELSDTLAAAAGLPAGRCEGTYVFLFQHGMWRYDKAEIFRIRIDGGDYSFPNGLGMTDEDTVAAYLLPDGEAVCFERETP